MAEEVKTKPVAFRNVMASRRPTPDALDFFPTPPWATRALVRHVLGDLGPEPTAWEPAAGAGHMAEVLRESFADVHASDVHDYGVGYDVGSFVGVGPDVASCPFRPDWIITNPPFALAEEFAHRAHALARRGVALLVRLSWIETVERHNRLFLPSPPSIVAVFAERVPMTKGRWNPDASTATAYAWVVWDRGHGGDTRLVWIPPGRRDALSQASDVARFAEVAA